MAIDATTQEIPQADAKVDAAPRRVRRFDNGSLAPAERLPNGWLKVEGRIARVGIQEYQDAGGGTHRELRLPEDVFDPESLASFHMVPVTNLHPDGLLDASTAKRYQVGSVGENVRPDGDYVAAPLMITDEAAIACAVAGRVQLSNGYSCELEEVPGTWEGQRYDAIQRRIRGNHVALVDVARAGPEARIRLDAGDAVATCDSISSVTPNTLKAEVNSMSEAVATKIDEAVAAAEKARKDERAKVLATVAKNLELRADAKKDAFKAVKHETMTCPECGGSKEVKGDDDAMAKCDYCDGKGKVSALGEFGGKVDDDGDGDSDDVEGEEELDADELTTEQSTEEEAKAAHKDAKDAFAKRFTKRIAAVAEQSKKLDAAINRRVQRAVKARVALLVEAHKHLGPDADLAKLDDAGVKKAVVLKLVPGTKLDGKSADAIDGAYEVALGKASEAPTAIDAARTAASVVATPARTDAKPLTREAAEAARQAYVERQRKAAAKKK